VKPDRVQNLYATHVSDSSCNVTWQFPAALDAWFPLTFRVEYSSQWSSNVTVSHTLATDLLVLCDLVTLSVCSRSFRLKRRNLETFKVLICTTVVAVVVGS